MLHQIENVGPEELCGGERFDALILAIRRDEHGIRAKERYFSPRDEDFKWNYKDLAMRDQRSFSLEFKALNYVEAIYSRHKLVQL